MEKNENEDEGKAEWIVHMLKKKNSGDHYQ